MNLCLAVDFTVTLMRLTETGDYVESGDKIYRYFFSTPASWADNADYRRRAGQTSVNMYQELANQFRLAEPNDPNYIAVKATAAAILTAAEIAANPWREVRPPVWENSPCVIVIDETEYYKVGLADFESNLKAGEN